MLIALLASMACRPPAYVHLDRDTVSREMGTEAFALELVPAVAWWSAQGFDTLMGDELPVRFAAITSLGHTDYSGITLRADPPNPPFATFVLDDQQCSYDQIYLGQALRHELGHALGLGHVEDETSVMYKLPRPCWRSY